MINGGHSKRAVPVYYVICPEIIEAGGTSAQAQLHAVHASHPSDPGKGLLISLLEKWFIRQHLPRLG